MSKCDSCGQVRTLNGAGLCHECNADEIAAASCVECHNDSDACTCLDGPWIPGGYRL
jgi:hypothetical protein